MYGLSNTVITILGQKNQLESQFGLRGEPINKNATLNTKYGINNDIAVDLSTPPSTLKFFGIGIGGSLYSDSESIMLPNRPSERNMDLYKPIPVKMIKKADRPNFDAGDYTLEQEIAINNTDYVIFWLKKTVISEAPSTEMLVVGDDGTVTGTAYIPEDADEDDVADMLFPTPPTSNQAQQQTIITSASLNCAFSGEDLSLVVDIYIPDKYEAATAVINEIGIYSGVEVNAGTTSPDMKTIMLQLAVHRCSIGHDMSAPGSSLVEHITFENGRSIVAS